MAKGNFKLIIESSEIAQSLISDLFQKDPDNVTFEQVGLIDGHETVLNFIRHGEQGCALDHLLYMVHESDIVFPINLMLQLHELANNMCVENYYSKENQVDLSQEQLDAIFNAP